MAFAAHRMLEMSHRCWGGDFSRRMRKQQEGDFGRDKLGCIPFSENGKI